MLNTTDPYDNRLFQELEDALATAQNKIVDLKADLKTMARELEEITSELENQRSDYSERFSLVTEPIEQLLKDMRDVLHRVRYRRENITPLEFIKEIESWITQLESAENEI